MYYLIPLNTSLLTASDHRKTRHRLNKDIWMSGLAELCKTVKAVVRAQGQDLESDETELFGGIVWTPVQMARWTVRHKRPI